MQVKVEGVKELNKRLSNMRAYVIRVSAAPIPTLIRPSAVDAAVEIAKEKYATPAGSPKYPLRWKSQKQRKYVMAKLRKANNIPYRRTGRFENAWSGSVTPKQIVIAHTARGDKGQFTAPFIIGDKQQPFHKDTGWTKRTVKIEREIIAPIMVEVRRAAKEGIAASKNA